MDHKTAAVLIANLIERLEAQNVALSAMEREALLCAGQALQQSASSEAGAVAPVPIHPGPAVPAAHAFPSDRPGAPLGHPKHSPEVMLSLVRDSSRLDPGKVDAAVTMCLDFGTARSKAFAVVKGPTLEYLPLAIGTRAGTGEQVKFSLASSVWIDEEHQRIYFGQKAVERSMLASRPGRRRIDSLKELLTKAALVGDELQDPASKLLSQTHEGSNPTDIPLTQGDALLLYLGFLTATAEQEVSAARGGQGHVKRRFALPCWDDSKRVAGERLMRRYLARAQIVADSVGTLWAEGLPVDQAKKLLEDIIQIPLEELPSGLVLEGIPEPVAAGGTRLQVEDEQRRLVMVVDVGAGTTDYALFLVVEKPETSLFKMSPTTSHTLSRAGNFVDDVLRKMLLDRAGLESGTHVRETVSNEIELRQRLWKEDLFKQGSIRVSLAQGTYSATLTRDELLTSPQMAGFAEDLERAFDETISKSDFENLRRYVGPGLLVVLTGGGANLPLVEALAKGRSPKHQLGRIAAKRLPPGVPQDVEAEYLQLAVAWGGAMPGLPEVGKTFVPIAPAKTNWKGVRVTGFGGR